MALGENLLVVASIFLMITSLTVSCEYRASSLPCLGMVTHSPSDDSTNSVAHDTCENKSLDAGFKSGNIGATKEDDGGEVEKEVRLEKSDAPGDDFTVHLLGLCVIVLAFWYFGTSFAYFGLLPVLFLFIMIVLLMISH